MSPPVPIASLAAVLGAVVAGAIAHDAWSQTPPPGRGQLVAAGGGPGGADAACFRCHGLDGGGQPASGFPRLAGLDARYLARQLDEYASGARPSALMAPIARALPPPDRQAVARYYAGLSVRIGLDASPRHDPALLQQGAVLYARGAAERQLQACGNCHGRAGRGIPPTFPSLAGQNARYVAEQLRLWRDGRRAGGVANVMRDIARRMSERDIEAAAAYVASLAPAAAGK